MAAGSVQVVSGTAGLVGRRAVRAGLGDRPAVRARLGGRVSVLADLPQRKPVHQDQPRKLGASSRLHARGARSQTSFAGAHPLPHLSPGRAARARRNAVPHAMRPSPAHPKPLPLPLAHPPTPLSHSPCKHAHDAPLVLVILVIVQVMSHGPQRARWSDTEDDDDDAADFAAHPHRISG